MSEEVTIVIPNLDESEFAAFVTEVEKYAGVTRKQFEQWQSLLASIKVELDKDPSSNLPAFYEKLELAQYCKNAMVDILVDAISYKAKWELYLHQAEGYLRRAKATLAPLLDTKLNKNKDLQIAAMYAIRPDIFECVHGCEMMLDWVKTMYDGLDAKLDLINSATLNINRQITVTELLTYKGLI